MNFKKLASAALTATTVLWMVGAAALPLANAQTTTSIAAQIAQFQAEIAQLTAELNSTSTVSTGAATYNFTSDLTVGSTGSAVKALQEFLIGQGDLVLATPTTYFGPMTQAALAKYQAAHSITPSVGYFGPKTRAYVNSLSTSSTTTTTTTTTTGCTTPFDPITGHPCTTSTTGTTPTGAPMTVSLDAQTPGATNVANGAVNTPVLKLDFTAGATPVTVTNLVLHRLGLSQDSDLDNVYLYNGATKLASNLGFNNGAITFSNGAGLFTVPANSTYVVTVTVDVDTATTLSGHIFEIGLESASDVTGGTFSGNFPLNSNQFTIANVSNLATLTISGNSTSTIDVNAGQTNTLVGQFNVQAGNNPVKLTSVTLTNIGNAQSNAAQNIKLMNGSTQLGATVSSLGNSNTLTFDLSNAPLMLTSGQSAVLSLYADITGGVGRNFQFSIQQSSDVQAVDTTYGVGIGASSPTAGTKTFPVSFYTVDIQNGGLVVSKDTASPTTYAVAGNTNQVLAKFDVLASGDSVKFNELAFTIGGGNTINNFRVVDDQGAQIGTTQNATGTYTAGSGSLNYIIPANTTRVLTVYGDLASDASGTVQVTFGANGSSAQSYTTFSSVGVSNVAANSLNILAAGTNLVASENYQLGSPVQAPANGSNVEIGSYTLTAGQVNSVNLTGISILTASATNAAALRNLRVMDGNTQVGSTQPVVAAGTTYNFNSNAPISIGASDSVTLDVYADINSTITATTTNALTTLTGINASTQSGNAVTLVGGSVIGQNVAFSNGGILTAGISPATSQASYLGMDMPSINVAQYKFTADTNGSETLTQINITDAVNSATTTAATDHSTFVNYRLTKTDGTPLTAANGISENASGTLSFSLNNGGYAIAPSQTVYVNLIADVNSYPSASSSATHAFAMTSYNYTNASIATTTTSTAEGNTFTVYRSTIGVGSLAFSAPNSISGVGNVVGAFTFTAGGDTSNPPTVKSITISTGGSLISSSTSQTLGLYRSTSGSQTGSMTLLATSTVASTSDATFNMTSTDWALVSGSNYLYVKPVAMPTSLVTQSNNNGSYQVLLQGVTWTDGITTLINSLDPSISLPVGSQVITNLGS